MTFDFPSPPPSFLRFDLFLTHFFFHIYCALMERIVVVSFCAAFCLMQFCFRGDISSLFFFLFFNIYFSFLFFHTIVVIASHPLCVHVVYCDSFRSVDRLNKPISRSIACDSGLMSGFMATQYALD